MAIPDSMKRPGVQSLLVIHQGALGDFILALPALESLRKTFPYAQSVMMGYPRILELVEKRFYADAIYSIDQSGMATFFVRDGPLHLGLSQFFNQFDLIILFGRDEEGPIALNLRKVCKGQVLQINSFPPWDEKIHLADHLLEQFSQKGIPVFKSNPRLYLNDSDRRWADDFWKGKGVAPDERSRVILLHPGSGSKKKVWPIERFLSLAQVLQDQFHTKILIILGPAEGPQVQRAFEGIGDHPFLFAKGLTLLQLASVMEGGWFFIGNDSGISHMAAALGIPTLTIFGPTDQRVWSPRGEKTHVVRKEIYCSPCPQERFFQCNDFECLSKIELPDVIKGLEKIGIKLNS